METPNIEREYDELAELVLDNYAPASTWTPEEVKEWCAWAAENNGLFVIRDGEELVGMAIARPLSSKRAEDPESVGYFERDEDGDVLFVDVAISTKGKPVVQMILLGIINTLGRRPFIAFRRVAKPDTTRTNKIHIYELDKFSNTLLGLKKENEHGRWQ